MILKFEVEDILVKNILRTGQYANISVKCIQTQL